MDTTTRGGALGGENDLTTTPYYWESASPPAGKVTVVQGWTAGELEIIGLVLWVANVIIIVGNVSCLYAVAKNIKALLKYPFFQSNVFCVFLSTVDVLLVILVGIPTAIAFTTNTPSLQDSFYNLAVVYPILDFIVWTQLLAIVAVCVDRSGHVWRPLRYTHTIRAYKTCIALCMCIAIPVLVHVVPYIFAVNTAVRAGLEKGRPAESNFKCELFLSSDGVSTLNNSIFLGCTLQFVEPWYLLWEQAWCLILMSLALLALVVSSSLIVVKLLASKRIQNNSIKRMEEVKRGIQRTCTVSVCQGVVLVGSILPFRWYLIDYNINVTRDEIWKSPYSQHYEMISRVLIFVAPMFNPWLYPIRMASIRSYLSDKINMFMVPVRTSITNLKSIMYGTENEMVSDPPSSPIISTNIANC